jgi:PKD repeat protein/DNA-binding beta-propeller fold protein YncE
MGPGRNSAATFTAGIGVILACLMLTGAVGTPTSTSPGGRANFSPIESSHQGTPASVANALAPVGASSGSSLGISAATAGRVARTIFLNYNANQSGNFPSAVWNWQVGAPAVDPSTGDIWIPTLAIARDNVSVPSSGPTIVYDPSTNESRLVWNLQNSSAFVIDPESGLLFATQPNNDSVAVFNPTTESWVGPAIRVGGVPTSIAFDTSNQTVFVANEATDNITVLNASSLTVVQPGIAVSGAPTEILSDSRDNRLYVALSAISLLDVVDTQSYSILSPVSLDAPATSLGFANDTDRLAVAMASSSHLEIFLGSSGGGSSIVAVGPGMTSVAPNANGSEFVIADDSGSNLTVVNSTLLSPPRPTSLEIPVIPQRLAAMPGNDDVLAWSNRTRQLAIVNLTTGTTSQASPDLGVLAGTAAYSAVSNTVIVTDHTNNSLAFLNASTLSETRSPLLLPGPPESIVASSTSSAVYVGFVGGVIEVDPANGAVLAQNDDLPGNNSDLIIVAPDGLLWDLNAISGAMALELSNLNGLILTGLSTGQVNLRGMAFDNATNNLYVVDLTNGSVAVINASTGAVALPWITAVPHAASVAYDPTDQLVYVLGYSVYAVDPTTSAVVSGPIGVGAYVIAWSITFDPSRSFLYVATSGIGPAYNGNITVLDGTSLSASQGPTVTIPVGKRPLVAVPVELPGAATPGSGEIWIPNDYSGTISVIASPPQVTFYAATPNPVDSNTPTQFSLGVSGGAGASTVSYLGLPTPCQSQNTLTLECQPSAKGTYNVTAEVTDSLGYTASAVAALSVSPAVHLHLHFGPAPFQVDLGSPFNGSATVAGGTAPYSYAWSYGDGSVSTGPSFSYTYSAVGNYPVTATVSDAGGGFSTATAVVEVVPLPTATITAPSSNVTDVNLPVAFNATVTGGTGSGTSLWSFGTGDTANTTNASYHYTKAGVYFATFRYTDASHHNTTRDLTITVNHVLGATVQSDAPSSSVSTGTTVAFNATISGGTPPFTVVWSFDDGSYASGIAAQHAFAATGSYTVSLLVRDAVGAETNVTYTLTVSAASAGGLFHGDATPALFLGFVAGLVIGALLLYVLGRRRKSPPSTPPKPFETPGASPPPPAPATTTPPTAAGDPAWKEE